jgi:cofilin
MSSGVAVHDDCVTVYNDLKLGHKSKFITFKITDDLSNIVVENVAPPAASYGDFEGALPSKECRYAVYDFEWYVSLSMLAIENEIELFNDEFELLRDAAEGKRGKIVFVLWAPDGAKVKDKMLYTSSKDNLRKKLVGIGTELQATDRGEISYEATLEKVNRK